MKQQKNRFKKTDKCEFINQTNKIQLLTKITGRRYTIRIRKIQRNLRVSGKNTASQV